MRIYIKGDYTRKVSFGYRELAWKMWIKERNGQNISFSNVGDDEMLQNDFYLSLRLDKWGASGSRWKDAKVKGGSAINSQKYENIDLEISLPIGNDCKDMEPKLDEAVLERIKNL